jgi:hypothetical protein
MLVGHALRPPGPAHCPARPGSAGAPRPGAPARAALCHALDTPEPLLGRRCWCTYQDIIHKGWGKGCARAGERLGVRGLCQPACWESSGRTLARGRSARARRASTGVPWRGTLGSVAGQEQRQGAQCWHSTVRITRMRGASGHSATQARRPGHALAAAEASPGSAHRGRERPTAHARRRRLACPIRHDSASAWAWPAHAS